MSDTKDLIAAIITGKDYNEIFAQVMANKTSELLAQKKEQIAQSMFEASLNPMSGVNKAKAKIAPHEDDEHWEPANPKASKKKVAMKDSYEEDESILEAEMTQAQMDKREEIVLAIKGKNDENVPALKKRYGARWKTVVYATATKQAMQ